MKKTYFRIIELPHKQVLLSKDFDPDEDNAPILSIIYHEEDAKISTHIPFASELERDKEFDQLTPVRVENYINTLKFSAL